MLLVEIGAGVGVVARAAAVVWRAWHACGVPVAVVGGGDVGFSGIVRQGEAAAVRRLRALREWRLGRQAEVGGGLGGPVKGWVGR